MEEKIRNRLIEYLNSSVISDILDDMGYRNNVFEYGIRPLQDSCKVFGKAFTVLASDVYDTSPDLLKLELECVDWIGFGEVMVITTNRSRACGFWGELLTTKAIQNGCAGAVIDGFTRDALRIKEMEFPLFVTGVRSSTSIGRTAVTAYQVPICISGVMVMPGDYIFGDYDGIVVIPQAIAEEVFEACLGKIEREDYTRQQLLQGRSISCFLYYTRCLTTRFPMRIFMWN